MMRNIETRESQHVKGRIRADVSLLDCVTATEYIDFHSVLDGSNPTKVHRAQSSKQDLHFSLGVVKSEAVDAHTA